MPKVQFILAIHNHQPVGNFEFVAEEAYQKAYLPFVTVLERHPRIKITLHYTGILYRFFEQKHPEFIEMLRKLVREGRAEVLSGGFYEPILAILPDEDKTGQVLALSDYIRRTLGYDPKGMWLAERVWEPHLPRVIAESGIGHVVVDDHHFKMAGLQDADLDGYYLTEEQRGVVRIFPGSERLRYLIPFHQPEETIGHLAALRSPERRRLAVMADDGEKFGIWPETYHSVYEEGWLERFFTLLEKNSEWLETTTFSDFCAMEPPRGRIYLPTASYMEMGEWSLLEASVADYCTVRDAVKALPDAARLQPFIKGGIWRNFLAKYPESNHLQKRMLMASRKVHEALRGAKHSARGREMLDHLYQSQCNDAYWHGIFGGLYLPHLRSGVYEHLIRAEHAADAALHGRSGSAGEGPSWIEIETGDHDLDGQEEVMVNTDLLNLFLDPAEGGRLTELDWKPGAFNLTNTLTRRRESYHARIRDAGAGSAGARSIHDRVTVKEEGLERLLQYDRYKRGSLLDHFLGRDSDLAGFMQCGQHEAGDFITGGYRASVKRGKASAAVVLEREGAVDGLPVIVRKEISARPGHPSFTVRYRITNGGLEELVSSFGCEFNFSLLAGDAPDRYYDIPGHRLEKRNLASWGETKTVSAVRLVDEWLDLAVSLSFSQTALLWRAPVETVSQSEGGFERVYQSSMVMPLWGITVAPGGSWEASIDVRIASGAAAVH